jgi:PKD repeat protein
LDYNIYVSSPGTYTLKLRAATPNGPDVCLVQVDYVDVAQINIANTGSWQTWQTFETTFTINTVGNHAIRLQAITDGFNINWIELCHGGAINNAPVALFSSSVQSGVAPLAVSFDATASYDVDDDALSYSWNFGDGTTASGINVQHTYTSEGNFVAVLTVNDGSLNAQTNASITVNVASNDCVVSSANGDFSVEISTDANNPTLTFVPTVQGTGNNLLLLYYGTNPNGPYPGSSPVPNVPFQINATAGQTVYFYYTYSLATGGENNSAANKNSFIVGQCESSLKSALIASSTDESIDLVNVYPNPVISNLTVELGNAHFDNISVIVVTGKVILAKQIEEQNTELQLNFEDFENGIYMLVLTNHDSRKVIRVCKQ